ncbi:MAG: hypothetical protein JST18_04105 [Bacteroidetes bacterium]|nr:hypothetical protein [Bacteroidota bacterium]
MMAKPRMIKELYTITTLPAFIFATHFMQRVVSGAIAILFLFITQFAVAQFHFAPATVYVKGDSVLHGWIDELPLSHFPPHIRFKQHEDDANHLFLTPNDITGFQMDSGDEYISFTGLVDSANQFQVQGKNKPAPARIEDALFLKLIEKGRINFYYCTDQRGMNHFFVSKAGEEPEELHSATYLYKEEGVNRGIYVSGSTRAVYDRKFRQQLLSRFKDCPEVFQKFADASVNLTRSSLKKWIAKYNDCTRTGSAG